MTGEQAISFYQSIEELAEKNPYFLDALASIQQSLITHPEIIPFDINSPYDMPRLGDCFREIDSLFTGLGLGTLTPLLNGKTPPLLLPSSRTRLKQYLDERVCGNSIARNDIIDARNACEKLENLIAAITEAFIRIQQKYDNDPQWHVALQTIQYVLMGSSDRPGIRMYPTVVSRFSRQMYFLVTLQCFLKDYLDGNDNPNETRNDNMI